MAKQKQQKQPTVIGKRVATKSRPDIEYSGGNKGLWWIGLLVSALGFLLYANTLGHDYCLDDFGAIKENWIVKGGLKNVGLLFNTEYRFGAWASPGSLYRPFSLSMFAFEWGISEENPGFYHAMNAVYYAISAWVLWITWSRILVKYPPLLAILTVLFFIAHPVHTEVVSNIKSRDEIMALMFGTISLYTIWRYFEKGNNAWLITGLVSYALALFSKESSITFLALIPLTIWYFTDQPISKNLKVSALYLIPAAIFLLKRKSVLDAQNYEEIYSVLDNFMVNSANKVEYFASAFMMCWKYLFVLIFPHPLVSDMGYPQLQPVNFTHWESSLGLLLYVGMGVWAVLNIGKKHLLSFAILFYLIGFSLFSNIILMIGTSYGERLLYLPSWGFALALAWFILKIFKIDDAKSIWNPNNKGTLVWSIVGVILALYCIKTVVRNNAWKNSGTLYAADLPNSPNCAKLNYHNSLEVTKYGTDEKNGTVIDSNQIRKGIACYNRTIELYPEYHDAYGSRGLAYFRLGDYNRAYDDYQIALKHRPNDAKVLSNMGFIYFSRGQLDKAEEVYRKSILYDPRFIDARRNLGAVLAMKKDFNAAIAQWQEGLKYEPRNATLLFYIGSAYKDMGLLDQAQPWLEKAYAIQPGLRK